MTETKKIEIAVVEDNNLFRKALTNFINESSEMRCSHSFSSCEDALKEFTNKQNGTEVILLDIGLPGMSGVECISHLRKFQNQK